MICSKLRSRNGVCLLAVRLLPLLAAEPLAANQDNRLFKVERTVASSGFDGTTCWVHARAGVIPASRLEHEANQPLVVLTMQKLLLTGSDVFYALHETRSSDLGQTWSEPVEQALFRRRKYSASGDLPTGASIAPELLQEGDETTVCDFTPKWHAASQRLLGLGHTVWYRDNRVMHVRPRGIAYAVYDSRENRWSRWQVLHLPAELKFQNAGAGSIQRVDLPGGDVLVPFYFKIPTDTQYSVTVARCRFDGHDLHYLQHGDELTVPVQRGLFEPSLTRFRGRFYLTMRNDQHGYVSVSDDGQTFSPPRRWTFDDGSDLGNYNTQQHWVTHSEQLFLLYTRRGANNDHVFRHRAPLFIARVDPDKLHVIRKSEQVLVPEHGARLGNFGVTDISPHETWVTVTEWMQPSGVERHGSDNRLFVAKLHWQRPNALVDLTGIAGGFTQDADPWNAIRHYAAPPPAWQQKFGDHSSPLRFSDGAEVASAQDWTRRRREIVSHWENFLGTWPPLITDPALEILDSESKTRFMQHRVRFRWTPGETTTGYLLVPHASGPHPAVLSVYYEPESAIGRGAPQRDFALQLARRGFVTLSIGTTEASAAKTYAIYHPSIENAEVAPLSMLGCAAANAWYVLACQPQVDAERIGIVGHSFGGKWALFAACLFDKFACAALSDPGIVFDEARPNVNYWEPWYLGYHPPPWRPRGIITPENPARGAYVHLRQAGHDLHELHALMAPRPLLISGGAEDSLNRWAALNRLVQVNRLLGRDQRVFMTNRADHAPNVDSNQMIYWFFAHFLQK